MPVNTLVTEPSPKIVSRLLGSERLLSAMP
jgi:hypothetical protein